MNKYELREHIIKIVADQLYADSPKKVERQDNFVNFRLDYEYKHRLEFSSKEEERLRAEIMAALVLDLTDVYWDGDVESEDVFLKVVDGYVKNPHRPLPIFENVTIYREFRPVKNTIEFAIYFHVNR